mmetsp:Transcript_56296/g.115134  ORF Transcript_56296/g.115134 Transcript_56296/m.115134 type:complete len:181 (-) Transcript_56296:151-693(-)|eukprot:CAMPEP_0181293742 /NCGR_PEP_ID=MMETSP1101-20121128/3224_1 /TAXON_ID=46948 /ORGANISM="Rhodomonas abbreviata, Strain Caron Lab Isolate" /LENGTH=180 /DNA_ID=CAMNT_0023398343 /DNA_START=143 /DNA_END=685 /DNA_ORIENTATION=+
MCALPDSSSDKKRKADDDSLTLEEMRVARQRLLDQSKMEKQAIDRISTALKELVEVINEERVKEHVLMNRDEFERCKVRSEVASLLEDQKRDGHLPREVIQIAKELQNFTVLLETRLPESKAAKRKAGKGDRDRDREREFDPPKGGANKTNNDLRRTVDSLLSRVSKLEDLVKHLQQKVK